MASDCVIVLPRQESASGRSEDCTTSGDQQQELMGSVKDTVKMGLFNSTDSGVQQDASSCTVANDVDAGNEVSVTSLHNNNNAEDSDDSNLSSLPDDDTSCALNVLSSATPAHASHLHQTTFSALLGGGAGQPAAAAAVLNSLSTLSSDASMSSQQLTDSLSLSAQLLQPASAKKCLVCDEEARGKFFGALVCLPCKTFFIRCSTEGTSSFKCRRDGSCDVTGFNRSRCKACRYRRCISVGMMRRERPERVEAAEGQQLCAVCGDVANGVHFGVVSCEGCKKFFRRGLSECESYECKHSRLCVINPRRRNDCRYCRYQKCLQVGMSRIAIKMGRPRKYSTQSGGSSHEDYVDYLQSDSKTPDGRFSPQPQASMAGREGVLAGDSHSHSLLDIYQHAAFPSLTPMPVATLPLLSDTDTAAVLRDEKSPSFMWPNGVQQASMAEPSAPYSFQANNVMMMLAENQQAAAQQQLLTHQPSHQLPFGVEYVYRRPSMSVQSRQRFRPYQQQTLSSLSTLPDSLPPLTDDVITGPPRSLSLADVPPLGNLPADERHLKSDEKMAQVASYWQVTHVPKQAAGSEGEDRLLTHRVLEAYYAFSYDFSRLHMDHLQTNQTLSDHPEQRILSQMVHVLDFIKSLPSFLKLCPKDSYNIARLAAMQVALLQAALGLYDEATHSLSASFLPVDLPPEHPLSHFRYAVLDFVRSFRRLKLDDTEAALLHSLLIFATDFPGLQEPDVIEVARAPLLRALLSHATVKYGPNNKRVSEMFSFVPCLRQLGLWHFHLTFTMPVTAL